MVVVPRPQVCLITRCHWAQEIMLKVKNADWFCPRTLMDHCHNLGIVIDLTDTFRYYHPEDFESRGVTHMKIRIKGRIIPEEKAVQKFFQAVNKFLEKNKENDKVIGVHCTHGINRSGYLVCRYMIQVLGIPPDQAIADFNSARGHEQERENYLADLRQAPWMDEAVLKYSRSNSKSKEASEYPTNPLDTSTASLDTTNNSTLDTTNNTTLDTTASEVESPGGSMGVASRQTWNIPLLKYPGTPEDESRPLPPLRRWSPVEERHSKRSSRRTRRYNPVDNSSEERPVRRHKERYSAYGARDYYDQIYQGRIAPQYDSHFYQHRGSGVGPHRPLPRYQRQQLQQGPSNAPRQYRGPRPYRSPPAADTNTYSNTNTPVRQDRQEAPEYYRTPDASRTPRLRSHGPLRNPLSPGVREDVFSPTSRRRSARMTPY
ncbi:uncharacterized protein LOC135111406 isoform X1 [Scylla paramamosain]|uniref:uncharacterized protein LOC135111406 isoform X1 n=1 Tax=Scylla paramamosain TaxID=85552 RepID=UPI0030831433